MRQVSPPRLKVEALEVRLREAIAGLPRLVVTDVMRAFLEISALPCEDMLWSFEFAFDEDDGRLARIEARFADPGATNPSEEELAGYEVHLVLPHVIPPRPADPANARASTYWPEGPSVTLVERFVRAFMELGAYRSIELIEVRSAEVHAL